MKVRTGRGEGGQFLLVDGMEGGERRTDDWGGGFGEGGGGTGA